MGWQAGGDKERQQCNMGDTERRVSDQEETAAGSITGSRPVPKDTCKEVRALSRMKARGAAKGKSTIMQKRMIQTVLAPIASPWREHTCAPFQRIFRVDNISQYQCHHFMLLFIEAFC